MYPPQNEKNEIVRQLVEGSGDLVSLRVLGVFLFITTDDTI